MKTFKDLNIGDTIYFIDNYKIIGKVIKNIYVLDFRGGDVCFTFDDIFEQDKDYIKFDDAVYILNTQLNSYFINNICISDIEEFSNELLETMNKLEKEHKQKMERYKELLKQAIVLKNNE